MFHLSMPGTGPASYSLHVKTVSIGFSVQCFDLMIALWFCIGKEGRACATKVLGIHILPDSFGCFWDSWSYYEILAAETVWTKCCSSNQRWEHLVP